jgi:hypothetical protein
MVSGTLDTRGGGGSTSNFGSIKIFGVDGQVDVSGASFNGGWNSVYGSPYNPENQQYVHPVS